MSNSEMMASFTARSGGKGIESKAELESRSKAVAKRFAPKPATDSRDVMLVRLGAALTLVAEARTIQESKAALDIVVAAKVYAERQKLGAEIAAEAHGIQVYAERRLGEMLIESPKAKGSQGRLQGRDSSGGHIVSPPEAEAPTIADLGISKRLSVRAQKLAKLPVAEVERMAKTPPKRKPRGRAVKRVQHCPACGHEW